MTAGRFADVGSRSYAPACTESLSLPQSSLCGVQAQEVLSLQGRSCVTGALVTKQLHSCRGDLGRIG
jgi:hypothetical protein